MSSPWQWEGIAGTFLMMDDQDPRSLIIPIIGTRNGHYLLLVIQISAGWSRLLKAPQLQVQAITQGDPVCE